MQKVSSGVAVRVGSGRYVFIQDQLPLEGGEELHHSSVKAAALGRHAAEERERLNLLPVAGGPVLVDLT